MTASPLKRVGSLSLDNFLSKTRLNGAVLSSPRSLEACRLNGVEPEELLPKPREAFLAANLPKEMIDRRWAHAEERRLKLLEKCAQTRRTLMEKSVSPDDSTVSNPSSSFSGRRSSDLSPASLSARRNREQQQQRLQRIEHDREVKDQEKLKKIASGIETAELNKSQHQERIREQGAKRWEEVVDRHNHAVEKDFESTANRYEALLSKEQQRDSAVFSTKQQNEEHWRLTGAQRDSHREAVALRSEINLERHDSKARELVAAVQRRQQLAEELQQNKKDDSMQKGEAHQQELNAAKRRAMEREIALLTHLIDLQSQKAAKADEARHALEVQRAQKELENHRKQQGYDATVQKATHIEESRKEAALEKLRDKHETNEQFRAEQAYEKLQTLEKKREEVVDHVEDVARNRKATEYQREQSFKKQISRCNSGVCSATGSPRGAPPVSQFA